MTESLTKNQTALATLQTLSSKVARKLIAMSGIRKGGQAGTLAKLGLPIKGETFDANFSHLLPELEAEGFAGMAPLTANPDFFQWLASGGKVGNFLDHGKGFQGPMEQGQFFRRLAFRHGASQANKLLKKFARAKRENLETLEGCQPSSILSFSDNLATWEEGQERETQRLSLVFTALRAKFGQHSPKLAKFEKLAKRLLKGQALKLPANWRRDVETLRDHARDGLALLGYSEKFVKGFFRPLPKVQNGRKPTLTV